MATIDWISNYPTSLDTDTQQPNLTNNVDVTRVSQVMSLRDALQQVQIIVGSDLLESGSLRKIISDLESSAIPGGSTNAIQYNVGGAFTGSANLTWNGSTLDVNGDVASTGGVKIADTTLADNGTIKYESNVFSFRQNGNWVGLSGAASGSNTNIQYNSSGSFAGNSTFTWDNSSKVLKIERTSTDTVSPILDFYKLRGVNYASVNDDVLKLRAITSTGLNLGYLKLKLTGFGGDPEKGACDFLFSPNTDENTVMHVTSGGKMILGDTTAGGVTDVTDAGLQIHQSWNSDTSSQNFLSVSNRWTNHGFTSETDNNTYLQMKKINQDYGGLHIDSFIAVGTTTALILQGNAGNAQDDTLVSNQGVVQIVGTQKNGTAKGALGNNEHLFDVKNYTTNRLSMNGLGDVYLWNGGIKPGQNATAIAGMIRWSGSDLEVYKSSTWTSLTSTGASVSPGGSDSYVQYNNGGSFGGDSAFVFDDSNKFLGLGTTSPEYRLELSSTTSLAGLTSYNTAGAQSALYMRKARNTEASPQAVQDADYLGAFIIRPYSAAGSWQTSAYLRAQVDGTPATINIPTRLEFGTNDGSALGTRLFISPDGKIATGGEDAPDVDPGGLCLNQDTNDGNVLTFKSSDISHGISTQAEADTYFKAKKLEATGGGAALSGYTDSDSTLNCGMYLAGFVDSVNSGDTEFGPITVNGFKPDGGTGVTALSSTENVFAVRNHANVVVVVKGNGDVVTQGGVGIADTTRTTDGTIKYESNSFSFRQNGSWVNLGAAANAAGSDGQIQYNNGGSAFGGSNLYYDDSNGWLGIGTSSPTAPIDVTEDNGFAIMDLRSYDGGSNQNSVLKLTRVGGTVASPSGIGSEEIGGIMWGGRHSGGDIVTNKAYVRAWATETWTSTANGTEVRIGTTEEGTTAAANRLRIFHDGKISTGNESAPDVDPGGLCLNHGGNDGRVLAFKNSDVSHPFNFVESDTYGSFGKSASVNGGISIMGLTSASTFAVHLDALASTASTGDTEIGTINLNFAKNDTGSRTDLANSEVAVSFRNNSTVKATIKGNGDFVTQGGITANNVIQTDTTSGNPILTTLQSDTAISKGMIRMRRSRASLGQTLNNDHIAGWAPQARTSTSTWQDLWNIYFIATQNITTSNQSSVMNFTARHNGSWITPFKLNSSGTIVSSTMYSGYTIGGTSKDVQIDSSGNIGVLSSSLRYKENVVNISDTSWVYSLRPVNFNYKEEVVAPKENGQPLESEVTQYGLIAEEVNLVNSDFVSYDSGGNPDGVLYSRFISVLIKEIQNLNARIAVLESA